MLVHRDHLRSPRPKTIRLLLVLMTGMLSACGSLAPVRTHFSTQTPAHSDSVVGPVQAEKTPREDRWFEPRAHYEPVIVKSRPAVATAQGVTLFAETWYVDPIIRPFSTAKALYSVVLKSTGGFLNRMAIGSVRFPLLEQQPIPPVADTPAMDLDAWERDLDEMLGSKASHGQIDFLVDGAEYFPRLTDAINGARDSIDIRTYIFDNDDVAVQVADLLRERSREVDVKVLVDGLGDLVATNVDSESMPAEFQPPASITAYLEQGSRVRVRRQSNPWLTGDHSKTTIIDRKVAFVGGMNIGREYRYDWHDLMMEVRGPIVGRLQHEFDKTWVKSGLLGDIGWVARMLAGRDRETAQNGYPIRILETASHNSEIYRAQLAAIRRAQNYIYIENAYFSDDNVLYELARARRRGVDVRVIMASSGDSRALNLSNELTINTMLRNGIRVYAYPGMTHVKAAVFDGWASLGSANFDKLSLQVNQEINLGTSHPETVQRLLDRVFTVDFARSTELHVPLPVRWTHHVAEFIADEAL
jgi:cardiolipin synthase